MRSASFTGMPAPASTSATAAANAGDPKRVSYANAHALLRILFRQNVAGDGRRRDAHVFKREVVGDNATPAVGTKFNRGFFDISSEGISS